MSSADVTIQNGNITSTAETLINNSTNLTLHNISVNLKSYSIRSEGTLKADIYLNGATSSGLYLDAAATSNYIQQLLLEKYLGSLDTLSAGDGLY